MTFSKRVVFHNNCRQPNTKNIKKIAEMGPGGSIWADIQPKPIPMHPGSFSKPSRAQGRLFLINLTKIYQKRTHQKIRIFSHYFLSREFTKLGLVFRQVVLLQEHPIFTRAPPSRLRDNQTQDCAPAWQHGLENSPLYLSLIHI